MGDRTDLAQRLTADSDVQRAGIRRIPESLGELDHVPRLGEVVPSLAEAARHFAVERDAGRPLEDPSVGMVLDPEQLHRGGGQQEALPALGQGSREKSALLERDEVPVGGLLTDPEPVPDLARREDGGRMVGSELGQETENGERLPLGPRPYGIGRGWPWRARSGGLRGRALRRVQGHHVRPAEDDASQVRD